MLGFRLSALLGAAQGAKLKGDYSQSFRLSLNGLKKASEQHDALAWTEFLKLSIEVGILSEESESYKKIANFLLSECGLDCPAESSHLILKLSQWGYSLGERETTKQLAEKATRVNKKDAEAWFFLGWVLLEVNVEESKKVLNISVKLDLTMKSRISEDKKCQKYL